VLSAKLDMIEQVEGQLENELRLKINNITNLENRIASMKSGLGWKLLLCYRTFADEWFPFGTRRRGEIEKVALRLSLLVFMDTCLPGWRAYLDGAHRRTDQIEGPTTTSCKPIQFVPIH